MKKIILLLTAAICFGNAYSQQTTFSKVLFDTLFNITETTSIPAFDEGYLIVGEYNKYEHINTETNRGLIIKVDANGDLLWSKTIGDTLHDPLMRSFSFNSIDYTKDSCYIMCGSFYNNNSTNNEGVCIKIDIQGDTIWTTTLVTEHNLELNSISQTYDLGYIVVGTITSWDNFQEKLFVAKLSPNGIIEWSKIYSNTNTAIKGNRVIKNSDSGFMILGNSNDNYWDHNNCFLIKLSNNGNIIWANNYKFNNESGENFLMFNDFILLDNGVLLFASKATNPALIRVDSLGSILWEKTYSGSYGRHHNNRKAFYWDIRPKLSVLRSGDYVFTSGFPDYNLPNYLIKTDTAGNPIFSSRLEIASVNVHETNNKELLIIGNGPILEGKSYRKDRNPEIGFIQTDSLGIGEPFSECVYGEVVVHIGYDTINVEPITLTVENAGDNKHTLFDVTSLNLLQRSGCVGRIGGVAENKIKKPLKVYPNPAAGMVTFESLNDKTGRLLIFNTLGKNIINRKTENYKTTLDLSGYGAGVYYYQFIDKAGRSVGGKVVIE